MSTILVNYAHLDPPTNGGASRIARQVGLALLDDSIASHRVIFVVRSRFIPHFRRWLGSNKRFTVIPYNRFIPVNWLIRFAKPDVVVSPLFGAEPFLDTGKIPHVVSMPDTLALDHPELFSASELRSRRQVYENIRSAALVITLSEYSRRQLVQQLGLAERQVETIALGADSLPDSVEPRLIAERYVFYPANTWPHKRHEFLFQVMSRIWQRQPQIKLVLTGGRLPEVDLPGLIAKYAPSGSVIDLGYVSEAQLSSLYAHAEAMIFTSMYEGFGMPVLEAMRAGCPVICAPLSAIREAAGDAALYVIDDTPEAWTSAFLERLPVERARLIEGGRQRAAQFTWAQTRLKWSQAVLRAARGTT